MTADTLTDRGLTELGRLVNDARAPLVRMAAVLDRAGSSRVTIPLGSNRVALVLTDDEARRAREVLG